MKQVPRISGLVVFTSLCWLGASVLAAPVGTAFSYQGRLQDAGSGASGSYDFQFSLWDAVNDGTLLGATQAVTGITVSNGLFAVQLDFGPAAFAGNACWLEVGVRTNGGDAFTALSPRQAVLPTPYAITANAASNLLGTLPATQLSGTLSATQLSGTLPAAQLSGTYSGPVSFNNGQDSFNGTFYGNFLGLYFLGGSFSGSFVGDGSGLINLNAAQLTGTVPGGRLAGPYTNLLAFGNPGNTFAGTFTGDGRGVTNLAGDALRPGTVNSNALDASTMAQLALAGAGNGGTTNWTNTATLFVDVNGNDATAVKGLLPWRTIQAALSNAAPGDVVRLGVGTWDVGTDILDIPDDVSLVGVGPGLSVIHTAHNSGASGHCAMIPGNNSVISGFTFAQDQPRTNFCYLFGAQRVDKSFTNVLVQNIFIDGETDGVYVDNGGLCTMTIRDSALQTKWDIMILSAEDPDSSFVVDNVQLTIDNRGATNATLIGYELGNFFGIGSRVSVNNCFGRMYIEDFDGGGGPTMHLVNAYADDPNVMLTMANCVFDFTCPAALLDGYGNAYPSLSWPLDTLPDVDGGELGYGMGILNPANDVGNTNCSFINVSCRYSNCIATYFVSQYMTNSIRFDLPGHHVIFTPE